MARLKGGAKMLNVLNTDDFEQVYNEIVADYEEGLEDWRTEFEEAKKKWEAGKMSAEKLEKMGEYLDCYEANYKKWAYEVACHLCDD
jgi:flagellar biosynthesis chaperone FliJ